VGQGETFAIRKKGTPGLLKGLRKKKALVGGGWLVKTEQSQGKEGVLQPKRILDSL